MRVSSNAVLGVGVALTLVMSACESTEKSSAPAASESGGTTAPAPVAQPKQEKPKSMAVTTASGLKYEILKDGTGAEAKPGQTVSVHYTGWLENGTKFDSSKDRGRPFSFQLGAGQVIRGWDEGVAGMKIGETRKLTIPSSIGYGARGAGGVIPPNATLIFEVDLLEVH